MRTAVETSSRVRPSVCPRTRAERHSWTMRGRDTREPPMGNRNSTASRPGSHLAFVGRRPRRTRFNFSNVSVFIERRYGAGRGGSPSKRPVEGARQLVNAINSAELYTHHVNQNGTPVAACAAKRVYPFLSSSPPRHVRCGRVPAGVVGLPENPTRPRRIPDGQSVRSRHVPRIGQWIDIFSFDDRARQPSWKEGTHFHVWTGRDEVDVEAIDLGNDLRRAWSLASPPPFVLGRPVRAALNRPSASLATIGDRFSSGHCVALMRAHSRFGSVTCT